MKPLLRLGASCFVALAPALVQAQSLRCQTAGYCTNELECFDDSSVFILNDSKGRFMMGWEEEVIFPTAPVRYDGFTVYDHRGFSDSIQTLVVADNLSATFSISLMLFDGLYTSFQALTCQRM